MGSQKRVSPTSGDVARLPDIRWLAEFSIRRYMYMYIHYGVVHVSPTLKLVRVLENLKKWGVARVVPPSAVK